MGSSSVQGMVSRFPKSVARDVGIRAVDTRSPLPYLSNSKFRLVTHEFKVITRIFRKLTYSLPCYPKSDNFSFRRAVACQELRGAMCVPDPLPLESTWYLVVRLEKKEGVDVHTGPPPR